MTYGPYQGDRPKAQEMTISEKKGRGHPLEVALSLILTITGYVAGYRIGLAYTTSPDDGTVATAEITLSIISFIGIFFGTAAALTSGRVFGPDKEDDRRFGIAVVLLSTSFVLGNAIGSWP